MTDYTVTATLKVATEAGRAQVQSLLDQGVKELPAIASRYGFTITDVSTTVDAG